MDTPALFSVTECSQMTGQTDIWDALDTTDTDTAADVEDGALFGLRVTDEPGDGALFGLGIA